MSGARADHHERAPEGDPSIRLSQRPSGLVSGSCGGFSSGLETWAGQMLGYLQPQRDKYIVP